MAGFLYRLGRFSFARHRVAAALWVVALVLVGAGGLALGRSTDAGFSVPGAESQRAADLLSAKFPQVSASGATARIVVEAPAGQTLTSAANQAAVEKLVAEIKTAPQVATVVDPYQAHAVNQSGTIVYIQVAYTITSNSVTDAARAALQNVAADGRKAGLTVEIGGSALRVTPSSDPTMLVGVLIAAVILFLTLGSLWAAGLPLIVAIFGIGCGLSAISIATHFVDLTPQTSTLAMMLGLAVAIDYSLFIVSRYRHELMTGREPADAAGRAIASAGSAVLFAGSTVVIALVALLVVGIPILSQIGVAAAFTVAVSVCVALTLLPALLGFAGRLIQPAPGARDAEANSSENGIVHRWAHFITTHRVPVVAAAVLSLLVVSTPILGIQLGLPDDSTAAPSSTQYKAYQLLSKGFGPGFNGPLIIVVEAPSGAVAKTATAQAISTISHLPNVVVATQALYDSTGETALFQVIPASGPSSQATVDLVTAIRNAGQTLRSSTGASLAVTGQTAINIDTSSMMGGALIPYLLVVVGLAILLLTLAFHSIVVPVKAALGFVLSLAATFGAVVAVFQWGWLDSLFGVQQTGPIIVLSTIVIIGIVFGLAMDYEVFLVSRMREEYAAGAEAHAAVESGFAHGARVVSAAAIIMIGVFGGFVLSSDALIKEIGFTLAVAVLFDAFVVRMTIVPAVMAIAGDLAWWLPGWLRRVLPSLDIEGGQRHTGTPTLVAAAGTGTLVPEPVEPKR